MINKIVIRNVATYDENGIAIENTEKINYIYVVSQNICQ